MRRRGGRGDGLTYVPSINFSFPDLAPKQRIDAIFILSFSVWRARAGGRCSSRTCSNIPVAKSVVYVELSGVSSDLTFLARGSWRASAPND